MGEKRGAGLAEFTSRPGRVQETKREHQMGLPQPAPCRKVVSQPGRCWFAGAAGLGSRRPHLTHFVTPAKAGAPLIPSSAAPEESGVPAFAGMTSMAQIANRANLGDRGGITQFVVQLRRLARQPLDLR